MHEMVKYHNDLNTVPMRKFSEIELNIFMAVVQQMRDKLRDKSTNKIQLSFDRLKELSNWKIRRKDDAEFAKHLHSVAEKLIHLSGTRWSPDGKSFDMFILFTRFKASSEQQTLDVSVNPEFEYILNDFAGGRFDQYELAEFVALSTTYGKALYRLLKQYRTTGYLKLSLDKFRELLAVPKSYTISDIDKNVFTKSTRMDMANAFRHLKIKKVYGKGRGKPLAGYEFLFDKEVANADQKRIEFDKRAMQDFNPNYTSANWDFRKLLE